MAHSHTRYQGSSVIPSSLDRFHGGVHAEWPKCFRYRIGWSLWVPTVWVWNWNSTFKRTVVRSDNITSESICVAFIYQSGTKGFADRWTHAMRGLQFACMQFRRRVYQSDIIDILCQPHSYRRKRVQRIAGRFMKAAGLTAMRFDCGQFADNLIMCEWNVLESFPVSCFAKRSG